MMASAPVLTTEGTDMTISQENETYVWSLLYELLEKRMKNGDFTIIDATHSRSTDFSRYNSLCDTYRYRRYVVSFTDVSKEVCIERNHQRDAYKRVPDEVIEKMYARFATQEKTSGWVNVPREEFWETFGNKVFDYNEYNQVHILGDIHGCFEPLKEYILKTTNIEWQENVTPENLHQFLNDEDAYIFVGDYLDRGIQNKEVLEFICSISEKKNVLLLEGNHERALWYWANELDGEIKSKEFMLHTVPQIKDIDPSRMRKMYRKLGQMAYFNFTGNNYLITHAGLNCVPKYLQLVSTSQFIRGVGVYRTPIDELYMNNVIDNTIQFHGHRNIEGNPTNTIPYSFSLEDRVEFGGNFMAVRITKDGGHFFERIKNNVFREETEEEHLETVRKETLNMENVVYRLKNNKNINESVLGDNISSFNFNRKAFEKGKWDSETVKARGLFIDTEKNKIVARGYEKFFNINEQESCKLFNLKRLFDKSFDIDKEVNEVLGIDYSVVAYKKYNGFLGILSYYNDKLQFHSKSTNVGEHVGYFKNLFYNQFSTEQINTITDYLKNHDVSMTFEVVDLVNDPHIIDEKESRVVLLDIIYNELEFKKLPYKEMVLLAKSWGLKEPEYKQVYTVFDSYRQLTEFFEQHKDQNNLVDTDIEGVVIESGTFMTKLKFSYYSFWKMMRTMSSQVMNGKNIELRKLFNSTANYFYKFVKDKYDVKFTKQQEILAEIGNDNITISDLNKSKLTDISIIKTKRNRLEDGYEVVEEEIVLGEDLINRIRELRQEEDIITLRNEYYANGGI